MADFLSLLESWAAAGGYLAIDGASAEGATIVRAARETSGGASGEDPQLIHPSDHLTDAIAKLGAASRANRRTILRVDRAMPPEEGSHGNPPGGELVIFSSGTTGAPKASVWKWQDLLSAHSGAGSASRSTVVIQYPLNCFAGVQGLIYALRNGRGIYLNCGPDWLDRLDAHANDASLCVLSTPSFWRAWLFGREGPLEGGQSVEMIALGGEPADQELLDRLAAMFPSAKIAHTYASTEFGSLFAVTDGVEGFPASFLERPLASGRKIKIEAGELFVECESRWRATGDLIELRGDRAFFTGRRSDLVNIAGWTVSLLVVEAAFQGVDGVADIRAIGRPNAITGNVIALDVRLAAGTDPELIREAILRRAASRLAPHERPRAIRFLSELSLTRSGKALRRFEDATLEGNYERG